MIKICYLTNSCTLKLGRRRPFILIYSIGIMLGLMLLGYGESLGHLIYPTEHSFNPVIIVLTVIGVVLLDFNCDACQSPARAYLIDTSDPRDHTLGLSTFTAMAGTGGALGYILGGIPWDQMAQIDPILLNSSSSLRNAHNLTNSIISPNHHKQIFFTSVALIYLVCMLLSITSFAETPLQASPHQETNFGYEKLEEITEAKLDSHELSPAETLKCYFRTIVEMPSPLKWLCLTHCFSWMSLLCFSLYFTDFVGEEIYGKSRI